MLRRHRLERPTADVDDDVNGAGLLEGQANGNLHAAFERSLDAIEDEMDVLEPQHAGLSSGEEDRLRPAQAGAAIDANRERIEARRAGDRRADIDRDEHIAFSAGIGDDKRNMRDVRALAVSACR